MWWGLATQGVGNVMEGYGHAQGVKAVEQAWRNALNRQQGFDDQAHARTLAYLSGLSPDGIAGTARQNQIGAQLAQSGQNFQAAAAKNLASKRGVPAGTPSALADLLREQAAVDGIAARQGGFAAGMQDIDNRSRQYQGDRNRIVRDAQLWESLLPSELRAAGFAGGGWRQAGQGMQMLGQGMTNWAMSQPQQQPQAEQRLAHMPNYPGGGVAPSYPTGAQAQLGVNMQPNYLDLWGR